MKEKRKKRKKKQVAQQKSAYNRVPEVLP